MRDTVNGEQVFGIPTWLRWKPFSDETIATEAAAVASSILCGFAGMLRIAEYHGDTISKEVYQQAKVIAPIKVAKAQSCLIVTLASHSIKIPWENADRSTTILVVERAVHFYVPHSQGSTNYYFSHRRP